MIRKLVQWLARHEIALSFDAGYERGRMLCEQRERIAYALGELEGQKAAFDAIDNEVHGRRIEEEDVARARKGMRH